MRCMSMKCALGKGFWQETLSESVWWLTFSLFCLCQNANATEGNVPLIRLEVASSNGLCR